MWSVGGIIQYYHFCLTANYLISQKEGELIMKNVIIYSTKAGATKECAELLTKRLCCPAYNITEINSKTDFSAYNTIILGTGVRMGKIYKPAKTFIRKNIHLLLEKRTAIFFCNAYPDTFEKAVAHNLPNELLKHAICVKSFGGKPPFTQPADTDWMNVNNINNFMEEL